MIRSQIKSTNEEIQTTTDDMIEYYDENKADLDNKIEWQMTKISDKINQVEQR